MHILFSKEIEQILNTNFIDILFVTYDFHLFGLSILVCAFSININCAIAVYIYKHCAITPCYVQCTSSKNGRLRNYDADLLFKNLQLLVIVPIFFKIMLNEKFGE